MKNNASKIKSKNGTNPGSNRRPNKIKLPIVEIKSLNNLSPFANTRIGFNSNPTNTGKKFATNADNPFAIKNGNTALAIGNTNNVIKPRFNKNNGNVRSALRSGTNNKSSKSFNKLINGNANNVEINASGKPSNRSLAKSPIVLIKANGMAIRSLNSLSGNKNGINNSPNPGINIAKVLNS